MDVATHLLVAGMWGCADDLPRIDAAETDDERRQAQVALDHAARLRERAATKTSDEAEGLFRSAGYIYQRYGYPWPAAYCLLRAASRWCLHLALEAGDGVNRDNVALLGLYGVAHQVRHEVELAAILSSSAPSLRAIANRLAADIDHEFNE